MAITVFSAMNALSIMTSEETHGAGIIPFNWKSCQNFIAYCTDNDRCLHISNTSISACFWLCMHLNINTDFLKLNMF
jgi:hypothetical protein